MKLDFYDHTIVFFCVFLVVIGGVFLGHEIKAIEHSAEIREANKKIEHCQILVTKGSLYE